jgi:hypothetical protein
MLIDPRQFTSFVAATEFPVVMAVVVGACVTLLGVVVSHRFSWIYPCIGIAVGVGAAFLIRWLVRHVFDRL